MSGMDNSFQIKKKGRKVRKEDKKRNCIEIEKKKRIVRGLMLASLLVSLLGRQKTTVQFTTVLQ
jgi:hypothetical protein